MVSNSKQQREHENLKPLRQEVRWLGQRLGRVLMRQEGKSFFEVLEYVRKTCIVLRRRFDSRTESFLIKKLRSLNQETIIKLIRAFTVYFQLVNLAEDKHRIRRKFFYENERKIQPGSLEDIVERIKKTKIPFHQIGGG